MKLSYYEVLQVSAKASPEVIEAAYQRLKPLLSDAARSGDQEARNQLFFLEESYAVLSSPEKRAAYDSASSEVPTTASPITYPSAGAYAYEPDGGFLGWWRDSLTAKLMLGLAVFAAAYSFYKFTGQRGEQQIQNRQVDVQESRAQSEAYRAENERIQAEGTISTQNKLIDRSYEVASQEAERRRAELEYRANAGSKSLEMQQQRLEAQLQQQRWAQEQYEKDRQMREAREQAEAPKKQLCNMYALNGNVRDARAAGCY